MKSLDMRSLEEQYADPRRTNRVDRTGWKLGEMLFPSNGNEKPAGAR